jgi:hypothetical protein
VTDSPIADAGRVADAAGKAKVGRLDGDGPCATPSDLLLSKRWYELPEEVRSPYQPE